MVDIVILELCKAMGPSRGWMEFKNKILYAEDIQEAREVLTSYLEHIYNVKRRKLIYIDTKSKGTLHVGYQYSGTEDKNILQAWCSFYDHKTRTYINPRTGARYYSDEEAMELGK